MKFLVIDLPNYFARFYYSNPDNCIDRYLRFVKKSILHFSPNYFINLLDADKSYKKDIYPLYKSNRDKKPEDFYTKLNEVKFNLSKFGFKCMNSKTLEADDLANLLVTNIPEMNFVILSNDKDLLQLEKENVKIYNYVGRKELEFEEKSIISFGVKTVEQFKLYLALKGDSSDNIPGIKGIGDKKALTIVNQFSYEEILEKIKDNNEMVENIKLNMKLVSLYEAEWNFDIERYRIK